MSLLKNKKILFFAPKFFNYENEISAKLEEFGAIVHLYDERPSNNFVTKALIRLNPKLLGPIIKKYYFKIINQYADNEFDYVFFFKGETVYPELISTLRSKFHHVKILLYFLDSLKNYPQLREYLALFDKVFSFDLKDANQVPHLTFRPLFYLDAYKKVKDLDLASSEYDILFIGTVHSDRWVFLNEILSQATNENLKVKYYLFFQSPIIFWVKKIFNKKFWTIPSRSAKFTAMSKDRIIDLIGKSKVIVDIQHPNQTGLTMRTIEVFGARRKLLTTNSTVSDYDFYDSSNIQIVDRKKPVIDLNFINSDYVKSEKEVYYKYSIEKWILDIFN